MIQRGQLTQPTTALVMIFLAAIALGTVLLMLPVSRAPGVPDTSFLTALFTATSAVCVTGLVVVDTATHWSTTGLVVLMVLFQLGGFGMMTAATLLGLLVNKQMRLKSKLLLQTETHALAVGDVKGIAKIVLGITVAVELAMALWLAARFAWGHDMPWGQALWYGMFHAVSAFNSAGFALWSDGLMSLVGDGWVLSPIMLASFIGGLGFPVLYELMQRRQRATLSMHVVLTLWGTVILYLVGAVVFYAAERTRVETMGGLSGMEAAVAALFTSVAARSSGFNVIDLGQLSQFSMTLHYALMFIGGGSASTAGGVKVTTFLVLLLVVWNEIRGNQDVEFRGRRIAESAQRQALTLLVLSSAAIVLGVLLMLPMTDLAYHLVLYEVISAFANVGSSTGITAQLPPAAQFLLVMLMFVGRVGVVTLAVALAMNHARRPYRYPEEKPIVG